MTKLLKIILSVSILLFVFLPKFSFLLAADCSHHCCSSGACGGSSYPESCDIAGTVCCDYCIAAGGGEIPLGQIGGQEEGFGPWGNLGSFAEVSESAGAFTQIISRIIGVITIIAGIWFIFQLIIGGYSYLTAGGESKKMSDAASKITSGLIGLVVIVAAYAIASLLGQILGFDILNPQTIIGTLGP